MDSVVTAVYTYLATYGLRIFAAVLVLLVGLWLARALAGFAERATRKAHLDETLTRFVRNLAYITLFSIVIIASLSVLGVPTATLVVLVAAAALAIGLAVQGSLSNFVAGTILLIEKPFKVGDIVEIAGRHGTVKEVHLFHTIINTPDHIRVIVPNAQITATSICNLSVNGTRRIDLTFAISYRDNIDRTRYIIMNVLTSDTRVLADPESVVAVAELGESAVHFAVQPWVRSADYWRVRFDLMTKIKRALDENNISIPYPQRDVHVVESVAQTPAGVGH